MTTSVRQFRTEPIVAPGGPHYVPLGTGSVLAALADGRRRAHNGLGHIQSFPKVFALKTPDLGRF